MPPWKAAPGFGSFRDERRLSDAQIELIGKWAAAGAPRETPSHLPEPPEHTDGWQLGEPDMVLKMPEPFNVPAGGSDVYRCFVIPIPLDEDTMVSAVEFRPGNHSVVHHAIMFLDAHGKGREKEGKDGEPGFESFGGPGVPVTGGLGAWVPGVMPRFLPDGFAKFLQAGSDLVLQIHYHPSGKAETDQSTVGLYFSKKPVKRIVTGIAIVQPDLHIPAGNPHAEVKAQTTPLPADVYVMGISPHMHNLGREIKVVAVDPTGKKTAPLIWIKDWDFNWQGSYQFARPIRLPKGSKIRVQAIYDNSAENPKNPNVPPKDVGWGEQTSDEMCLVSVQVCADTPADLRKIAGMFGHELAAGIEGGVPPVGDVAKRKSTAKARTAARQPAAGKGRVAAKPADSDGLAGVAGLAQKLNAGSNQPAAAQTPPAAPDPTAVAGNSPSNEPPADGQADNDRPQGQKSRREEGVSVRQKSRRADCRFQKRFVLSIVKSTRMETDC